MDLNIYSRFDENNNDCIETEKSLCLKEFPYDTEICGTEAIAVLQTIAINANYRCVDERFEIDDLLTKARLSQKNGVLFHLLLVIY